MLRPSCVRETTTDWNFLVVGSSKVGSDTCDVPKSPTGSRSHGPLLTMKSGDLISVFSPSQPIKHSFSDAESQARILLKPDTLDLRPCFFWSTIS